MCGDGDLGKGYFRGSDKERSVTGYIWKVELTRFIEGADMDTKEKE